VTYGYDNAENRTSDLRQAGGAINVDVTSATALAFDPGDRIKTESGNGSYGSGDNIAPFNGITLNFERDLDGNLTRRYGAATDIRYGWDALGRLDTVKVAATGATVIYDYSASGQLVRRRTNGTIDRHFLWEGDNLLAELNGTATSRVGEYVYWGLDQPLAILTGSATITEVNYHVQDALGNVKLLFNQTASATINFQTEYSDWGTPVNTTSGTIANRLLFKGMFYEGDSTRLYYARNRWYSPDIGGFMSEDPLGIGGGLNTYAFGGGDPVNNSDPRGLEPDLVGGEPRGISPLSILIGKVVRSFFRHDPPSRPAARMPETRVDPFGPGRHMLGGGCAAIADHCDVDLSMAGPMAGSAAIGAVGGIAVMAGTTELVAGAASTCSVLCKPGEPPIEGFANWGLNIVQWGATAKGALQRAATITEEEASQFDPAVIQKVRDWYTRSAQAGRGGDAAPARAELMQKILDLMKR
jgi:RHS repeat-associated protein